MIAERDNKTSLLHGKCMKECVHYGVWHLRNVNTDCVIVSILELDEGNAVAGHSIDP